MWCVPSAVPSSLASQRDNELADKYLHMDRPLSLSLSHGWTVEDRLARSYRPQASCLSKHRAPRGNAWHLQDISQKLVLTFNENINKLIYRLETATTNNKNNTHTHARAQNTINTCC